MISESRHSASYLKRVRRARRREAARQQLKAILRGTPEAMVVAAAGLFAILGLPLIAAMFH